GGEMFRVECDAILRIPDDNSGAVEIQTAWSIDKVPVELNVPILHATKAIEVPDISTSHSQGLYANFRVRSQGRKTKPSPRASIDTSSMPASFCGNANAFKSSRATERSPLKVGAFRVRSPWRFASSRELPAARLAAACIALAVPFRVMRPLISPCRG